jgi:hypothetical protein
MASALLHRLKQHHRAAQRRLIIAQNREPAWYTTHRRQFQADLARHDIDPLWFGQALYIQFLGSQIVAVEYALCDDGEATAQRFAAARGRQAWQIVALAKRLCVLAQVPSVSVYVQSGRLPITWAQLLKDLGLASIARSQRARLVAPVLQLMPDVQDALAGQCVSGRVLCVFAWRPPAEQRALLTVARQLHPTPLSRALRQQLQLPP